MLDIVFELLKRVWVQNIKQFNFIPPVYLCDTLKYKYLYLSISHPIFISEL